MSSLDVSALTTWIEVSTPALRHNIRLLRGLLSPGTRLLAVVKANAYGHGAELVARVCQAEGVDMLGVHSGAEALGLRRAGLDLPLLIMGYLTAAQVAAVAAPDVHVLVSSRAVLDAVAQRAAALGRALPVHLKLDTGTHRQGVPAAEAVALAREARARGLEVAGIATHFANIEDTTDHSYALRQLESFREGLAELSASGAQPPLVHAACSAAALLFRQADFSMVRVGISLYGHWPSKETYLSWLLEHGREGVRLEPALAWRARVGQVKEIAAGAGIGYGLTYRTTRATRLAVLPVGYAEGYPRALSNRARVLIASRPAAVVGRVCMNVTMVDVTDTAGVAEGAVATLIGRDGDERVSAEELAEIGGTINYELLARLSPELPRFATEPEVEQR